MQAVSSSSARLTWSETFERIDRFYCIAKSICKKPHYERFEKAFRGSFYQIYPKSWDVQPKREWFTLLDPDGCTLLLRAMKYGGADTPWVRCLAIYMPENLLLQRARSGDTVFDYASCCQAFGTLRILLQRQPNLAFNGEDLLLPAIRRGGRDERSLVLQLLKRRPEIVRQDWDEQGKDALDWAWQQKWMDVVEQLVRRLPPDRLAKLDKNGDSLLERAIQGFHGDIASILIDRLPPEFFNLSLFFDPPRQAVSYDYSEESSRPHLLTQALWWARGDVLMGLMNKLPQGEFFCAYDGGYCWLSQALGHRREGCIPALMQHMYANESHEEVYRALNIAAAFGDIAVLQVLVDYLRDNRLDMQTNLLSPTPLHAAILHGCEKAALFLTECSSPLELAVQDLFGATPLHLAVDRSMSEAVKAIAAKMKPETLSLAQCDGHTPLHKAVLKRNAEIVQILIGFMQPEGIAAVDHYGDTALHLATRQNLREVVSILPCDGPIVRNKAGCTALHIALNYRRDTIARDLIRRLRQPEIFWVRDKFGSAPMDLARSCKDQNILKEMKSKLEACNLPVNITSNMARVRQIVKEYAAGNYELALLWSYGPELRLSEAELLVLAKESSDHWDPLRFSGSEARRFHISIDPKKREVSPCKAMKIAHFLDPNRILALFTSPPSEAALRLQKSELGRAAGEKFYLLEQGIYGLSQHRQEERIQWYQKGLRAIPPHFLALAWQGNRHRALIELAWKYVSFAQHTLLLPLMGDRITEFYEALPDEVKRYSAELLTADQCTLLCGGALKRAEEKVEDITDTIDFLLQYKAANTEERRGLEADLLDAEERITKQRRRIEGSLREIEEFAPHAIKGECTASAEELNDKLRSCLAELQEVSSELSTWVEEVMPP